jgi:hypothetical protein
MQRTTYREESSSGERIILARFATRLRRGARHAAETITYGTFVAL